MSEGYEGPVTVFGSDGVMLTTGAARLEPDPEVGGWKGLLQTLAGTAVAGKALVVDLVTPDGGRGRAQLLPEGVTGDRAISSVVGLGGPWPFLNSTTDE